MSFLKYRISNFQRNKFHKQIHYGVKKIWVKDYGGPFYVLGWITPAILWPNDSGVGESRLA